MQEGSLSDSPVIHRTRAEIEAYQKELSKRTYYKFKLPQKNYLYAGQEYLHPHFDAPVKVLSTGEIAKVKIGKIKTLVHAAKFLQSAILSNASPKKKSPNERHWVLLSLPFARLKKLRKVYPKTVRGEMRKGGVDKVCYYKVSENELYFFNRFILEHNPSIPLMRREVIRLFDEMAEDFVARTIKLLRFKISQQSSKGE